MWRFICWIYINNKLINTNDVDTENDTMNYPEWLLIILSTVVHLQLMMRRLLIYKMCMLEIDLKEITVSSKHASFQLARHLGQVCILSSVMIV